MSFSDQAMADRLVREIRYRFRYVPAWRLWLEYRDGLFSPERALENLLRAYLDSLADLGGAEAGTRRDVQQRLAASSASAQQWLLWMIERDARMVSAPEEFDFPGPYRLRPDPVPGELDSPEADAWLTGVTDVVFSVGRDHLQRFFSHARARVGEIPNVLIRTSHAMPELGELFSLAEAILGPRAVVRLGPRMWAHFPDSLSPEWALALTGASLCFLEGVDKSKNQPQDALLRWARGGEATWFGYDKAPHVLRLPTHFIVCGQRWKHGALDVGIRRHLIAVEG